MDYKNGKIYKITDNAYTKMYIGSTTQPLSKRFSDHKSNYKSNLKNCTSYDIFDEFGIENCKIELIEEYECKNRNQLERKEGEHIKNNDCVNKAIAGRTNKEYHQDNKDKISELKKEYYQNNRDKKKDNQKIYYEVNKQQILNKKKRIVICECGTQYSHTHKSRHIKSKKHIKLT